jgi:SAM-dependent methyltransferase
MSFAPQSQERSDSPPEANCAYYEKNAERYFQSTAIADLSRLYGPFLMHIPSGGRILDAGSGSGRDTLAFLKLHYRVDAFDRSTSLARLSSRLTGQSTRIVSFEEFTSDVLYDGVWACASLLHVPYAKLPLVIERLGATITPGGVLYASFRYGHGERVASDGRVFTDLDFELLAEILARLPAFRLRTKWISSGEDVFLGSGEWLNILLDRTGQ